MTRDYPHSQNRLGHGIYTWASRLVDGSRGFGYAALSPYAEASANAFGHKYNSYLTRHPAADKFGNFSGDDNRHIAMRIATDTSQAIIVFFTRQGVDGNGRPGRHAAEFYNGPASELTISTALALEATTLVGPGALPVDIDRNLPDTDITSLTFTAPPFGMGDAVSALIDRLHAGGWRSVEVSIDELPTVQQLLGVLHPAWDVVGELLPHPRNGKLIWMLALPDNVTNHDSASSGSMLRRCGSGDDRWRELKREYGTATSHQSLTSVYERRRTIDNGDNSNIITESHLDTAVDNYLTGKPSDLAQVIRALEARERQLALEAVLHGILRKRGCLQSGGVVNSVVNRELLEVAESSWAKTFELGSILPKNVDDLVPIAESYMDWKVFSIILDSIADQSQRASNVPALHPICCSGRFHDAVRYHWRTESEYKDRIIRAVEVSGPGRHSLAWWLLELATSGESLDFAFTDVLPTTMDERDLFRLVTVQFDRFRQWMSLPGIYWELLRVHSPPSPFLKMLRIPRRS